MLNSSSDVFSRTGPTAAPGRGGGRGSGSGTAASGSGGGGGSRRRRGVPSARVAALSAKGQCILKHVSFVQNN